MAQSEDNASEASLESFLSRELSITHPPTATHNAFGMLPYEVNAGQHPVTATRSRSRTLSYSLDIKLQFLCWTCFLLYSQLEDTFVLLPLPRKSWFYYSSHIFGIFLSILMIRCFGLSSSLKITLFITGVLTSLWTMLFPSKSEEAYNLLPDPRKHRLPPGYYVCRVIIFLCGSLSAIALPGVFLLVVKYFPQEAQPWRLIIASSSGICGKIIAETNCFPPAPYHDDGTLPLHDSYYPCYFEGSNRKNLILKLQGLAFALVALATTLFLDTKSLDCNSESSCQGRVQARRTWKFVTSIGVVYKALKPQICQSLKDPQAYFFLALSALTGLDRNIFPPQLGCWPYTIYPKIISLLWYIIIGCLLWQRPNLRISLTVFIVFVESAYSIVRGQITIESVEWNCFQAKYWLSDTSGELSFISNVRGAVRTPFVIGILITGYNLGTMVRMSKYRLPIYFGSFRHVVYFFITCNTVKVLGLALYAYWVVTQNRKKKKLVRDLGISEEYSDALKIIAESEGMTDIENIHFKYGY